MKNLWLFQETRLEILQQLLRGTRQVQCCDLLEELKLKKTSLSYHLNYLKRKGVVREIKRGRQKCYFLAPSQRSKVKQIIKLINS